MLSPDIFSLYSEIIMQNLEGYPGIKVGGLNLNNLRHADDTVLLPKKKKPATIIRHSWIRKQKERVGFE